jgi:hypothetical protein
MMFKKRRTKERGLALFEIFLLVISIAAFAYLIGDEFEIVGAADAGGGEVSCTEDWDCSLWSDSEKDCGTRTCTDLNDCDTTLRKPDTIKTCPAETTKPCSEYLGTVCTAEQTCSTGAIIPGTSDSTGGKICCIGTCKDAKKTLELDELLGLGTTVASAVKPSAVTAPATATPAAAAAVVQTPEQLAAAAKAAKTAAVWKSIGANMWNILGNAAIAYGLYWVLAKGLALIFPGADPALLEALGQSAGWGYGIGSFVGAIANWIHPGFATAFSFLGISVSWIGLAGLAIGVIIWFFTYHQESVSVVKYSCYPWQPKSGGEDCNKCNGGEFPCTEYKCKSLGQGCELLNPGTSDELCTWVNRNDIGEPLISAWDGPLDKEKYQYVPDTARLPPDKGVIIKYKGSSDGCIPPFSKITYGVTLNKPGTCKADIVRKSSFKDMLTPISNGRYLFNHTLLSIHAGANESEAEGTIDLPNGGNYEIFIRCESKNGYSNTGTFVFKYCVSDEPDTTPPTIESTNPINGMPVQAGKTSQLIEVYTNKPADCRWSHNDEDYETMVEKMTCTQSITEINANMLYKCSTTLTGLKDSTENNFYFNCKSYPLNAEADRYKMSNNYVYKLIGTKPLVLDSVSPASGTVMKDATASVKVTLQARTSAGYNDGEAKCSFKQTSESDKDYVLFMNTNSYQSSQDLWMPAGSYDYSINCCDLGGNCVTKTTAFTVETDFQSPIIVRAYNEAGNLKVVTSESGECVYDTTSCSYNFEDGLKMSSSDNINHFIEWNTDSNFYIKCEDGFGNQPAPDACSMIIRPFSSG